MNTSTQKAARSLAAVLVSTLLAGAAVTATTTSSDASAPHGDKAQKRKFSVTLSVSDKDPEQGDTIKITGKVRPLRPGKKVRLEKRFEGSDEWKLVEAVRLDKRSRYTFEEKIDTVQFREYRVVKPADKEKGGTKKTVTDDVDVTVYGWRYLTTLGAVSVNGMQEIGSVNINGKPYSSSIVSSQYQSAGTISYNINRGCKTFEAQLGVGDNTADTATGTVAFSADGTQLYSNSFALTQSATVTKDVTNAFRIKFDWGSTNTAGSGMDPQAGAIVAVGSPRLLCNF